MYRQTGTLHSPVSVSNHLIGSPITLHYTGAGAAPVPWRGPRALPPLPRGPPRSCPFQFREVADRPNVSPQSYPDGPSELGGGGGIPAVRAARRQRCPKP